MWTYEAAPATIPITSGPGTASSERGDRRRSALRFAVSFTALATLCLAGLLFVTAVLPSAMGRHPVVLTSGSMSPTVRTGDVLVAEPYRGEALSPGQVVVFGRRGLDGRDSRVTHRIVRRNADGSYVTRGDANADVDSVPLYGRQVEATATYVVPWVGRPLLWWQRRQWLPLAIVVLGLAQMWQLLGLTRRPGLAAIEPAPAG
jgi:signal peptidase I